jgi:nucleoid-associated protein YgaU
MIFIPNTEPKTTEKLEKENKELREKWNCARLIALISATLAIYFGVQQYDIRFRGENQLNLVNPPGAHVETSQRKSEGNEGLEKKALLLEGSALEQYKKEFRAPRSELKLRLSIEPYTVKSGDTLSEIAERNETKYDLERTIEKIINLNNIIVRHSYNDVGSYGDSLKKVINIIPRRQREKMRLITDPDSIQAEQVILIPKFE